MAGPGYRTKNGVVEIGSANRPVNVRGADENLPVDVEEGLDTEATLTALLTALDSAGIINYIESE